MNADTTVRYEIEIQHLMYGEMRWTSTALGQFHSEDEAKDMADGLSRLATRIVKIETTRTVI